MYSGKPAMLTVRVIANDSKLWHTGASPGSWEPGSRPWVLGSGVQVGWLSTRLGRGGKPNYAIEMVRKVNKLAWAATL